jgi:hypothetical protein
MIPDTDEKEGAVYGRRQIFSISLWVCFLFHTIFWLLWCLAGTLGLVHCSSCLK